MNREEARKRQKTRHGGQKPPQQQKSEETIVIDYLTKMMDNLGVNSVKNANELPRGLWDYMRERERLIRANVKHVAQEKRLCTEQSFGEKSNFNRSNNNNNNNNRNGNKNGKNSRNNGRMAGSQPQAELMRLGRAQGIMDFVEAGSSSLIHDKFPYFYDELANTLYMPDPDLDENIYAFLRKTVNDHRDFIDETNCEYIETLDYIQYRRNFPNSPIDYTLENGHPMHTNPLLFKLITNKNPEIPPRIETHVGYWKYIANTILTISRQNAILFAIDIEGFESNQNIITEIGISIYDPRENLREHGVTVPILRNYHLIVSEFFTLRNKNYLTDVKDCYLLGESIILPYDQCADFIQSLVNFYMFPKTAAEKTWGRCFVGHGMANDLNWLKSMGIKFPPNMKDISYRYNRGKTDDSAYIIDTSKLHQIMYGDTYGSLGKNLKLHKIPHSFLHNAGNDAYYTLQLLLNIGNFRFRKLHRLDKFELMAGRIRTYQREDDEAMGKNINPNSLSLPGGSYKYNIPLSDIAAVIEFIKMNNESTTKTKSKKKGNNRREADIRKRRENLLGVSQFHGMKWEDSVIESFLNVDDVMNPNDF